VQGPQLTVPVLLAAEATLDRTEKDARTAGARDGLKGWEATLEQREITHSRRKDGLEFCAEGTERDRRAGVL
jgi:hypothetical protein